MDLTRLYNFTTSELREEAERLGIGDTYAMSRGQLVQAIREHLEPPTARKKGLFGRVVGFAKWAVQAAVETGEAATDNVKDEDGDANDAEVDASAEVPDPLEARSDPGAAAAVPKVYIPKPEHVAAPEEAQAGPEAAPPAEAEPEDELKPELGVETQTEVTAEQPAPEPAADATPDTTRETAPDAAIETVSGFGSSRPPAGVFANNGGLFEEPIPTRTMARILAEQGHFKRSLAIYARLLDEEPDDGDLLAEVNAVREEAKTRRSYAPQ